MVNKDLEGGYAPKRHHQRTSTVHFQVVIRDTSLRPQAQQVPAVGGVTLGTVRTAF